MSIVMEEDIKRWTAKRKTALVLEIIQGKTTVAEASRSFDLPPSEVEDWVDEAKRGMENALRAKPLDFTRFGRQLIMSKTEWRMQHKAVGVAARRVESLAPCICHPKGSASL